jgi:hypothetical protein
VPGGASKPERGQSPSYPEISLDVALERARTVLEAEGPNWVRPEALVRHWGYAGESGDALVTLTALKEFGLVEDKDGGDRRIRLTDLARHILLDESEDSPERLRAIQVAALTPEIHRRLWERYWSSLPSDETLKRRLENDGNFTDEGVDAFIGQLRRTMAFARLTV